MAMRHEGGAPHTGPLTVGVPLTIDPVRHDTDKRVRERLDAGDAAGAATLAIRTIGPPVLRYLHDILGDDDDTKEAFSQWAECVWRDLPSFRGEAALQTWAFRVAYHAALGL